MANPASIGTIRQYIIGLQAGQLQSQRKQVIIDKIRSLRAEELESFLAKAAAKNPILAGLSRIHYPCEISKDLAVAIETVI